MRGIMASTALGSLYVLGFVIGSLNVYAPYVAVVALTAVAAVTLWSIERPERTVRSIGELRALMRERNVPYPAAQTPKEEREEEQAFANRLNLAQRQRHARIVSRLFASLFLLLGGAVVLVLPVGRPQLYLFVAIALILWFVYFQTQLAYLAFADEFAKAVYRAFVSLPRTEVEQKQPVTSGN